MAKINKKNVAYVVAGGISGLIVVIVAGFIAWALMAMGPMTEVRNALVSDEKVKVVAGPFLAMEPGSGVRDVGLILYPGARVHYEAYAPLARSIAEKGYTAVIVPMPLNLAFFGAGRAGAVMDYYSNTRYWVVGGHSLGGAMAARYVKNSPDKVKGLVLLAAYPAGDDDLSKYNIGVVSIYGDRDAIATPQKVLAARPLLPSDTSWVEIKGGNHSQFAWYGLQPGDNEAGVTRQEQQAQVVAAILKLLDRVAGN